MNNIWLLCPRTNQTRVSLIVSGFNLDGKYIDAFDDNPLKIDGGKVIKDLPATVPPHVVRDFLKGYPQLKMRSKFIYAKERIGGEEMSPFINGDRFVYVSPLPSPRRQNLASFPK